MTEMKDNPTNVTFGKKKRKKNVAKIIKWLEDEDIQPKL